MYNNSAKLCKYILYPLVKYGMANFGKFIADIQKVNFCQFLADL